jgi:hypothetical protein
MTRLRFILLAAAIFAAPVVYETWWHIAFGYTTCLAGVLK